MIRVYCIFGLILFVLLSCGTNKDVSYTSSCRKDGVVSERPADTLGILIDSITRSGAPGCVLTILQEGTYTTWASGVASIEAGTKMSGCHLQYLQSISKTYMASLIMLLHEEDRIDLDDRIERYLPEDLKNKVPGADRVTVRMLLNHTSGMPEYNYHPRYVSYLLQHPEYVFDPVEYLDLIKGKPLDFLPGSRYSYRNSNYVILALMADHITGDHAVYMREKILEPLGLKNTFYRDTPAYLENPYLVEGYWDRFSNGSIENISGVQQANVAGMIGDDGLITTPEDAVRFLKALMSGDLVSGASLEEMTSWVQNDEGENRYGLGLGTSSISGFQAIGHSGGGLGAGCELYYFPEKELYMFIGINLGTVTYSPLHDKIALIRQAVFDRMLTGDN